MLALVAFDVADEGRRRRLTEVLLDYGQRVEESVFWVECDDELRERMEERVRRTVAEAEDKVWILPLCLGCAKRVVVLGQTKRPEMPEYYIE